MSVGGGEDDEVVWGGLVEVGADEVDAFGGHGGLAGVGVMVVEWISVDVVELGGCIFATVMGV